MVEMRAVLEKMRKSLLDLTRRNRLLNFRSQGRGSLRIVDELPEEVWRIVVDEGQAMQFLAREEAGEGVLLDDEDASPTAQGPDPIDPIAPVSDLADDQEPPVASRSQPDEAFAASELETDLELHARHTDRIRSISRSGWWSGPTRARAASFPGRLCCSCRCR